MVSSGETPDAPEIPMGATPAGPPPVRLNLPAGLQIGTDPCPACGSTIRPCQCEGGITAATIRETARAMEADRKAGGRTPEGPPNLAPEPQGPTGPYFAILTYPLVGDPGVPDLEQGWYVGWVDDPVTAQQVARGASRASRWSAHLVRVSDREQPRWEYVRGRRTHTYPVQPAVTFGEHADPVRVLWRMVEHFGEPAVAAAITQVTFGTGPILRLRSASGIEPPAAAAPVIPSRAGPAVPGTRPGVDPDETIEITQD